MYIYTGIIYNIPELKNCREHAELKNFVQYAQLLHFRSANGKQGNLSNKKKNLKPQIKGVFQF